MTHEVLQSIPIPPGWTAETPTETGTYDFFGWVDGRTPRGSTLPSRVRIYAPNGVWQHATYEHDFASKAFAFHGIWRRATVTEAEAAYNLAWRVVHTAHRLELYRKENPWTRHVSRYTMGIPDSHEDMGDATLAALVEAGVLTPTATVQGGQPMWKLLDSPFIPEHAAAWLRAKFGTTNDFEE